MIHKYLNCHLTLYKYVFYPAGGPIPSTILHWLKTQSTSTGPKTPPLHKLQFINPPFFQKLQTPHFAPGTGSLFSLLKSLGWASSLVAGESGSSMSCASFFYISVELTLEGYAHVQEVGASIFRCGTWP